MFTDLYLQVALGSVPSSQSSNYRLPLWVRQSGQLQSLKISLYRSPIAGAKEDEKKLCLILGADCMNNCMSKLSLFFIPTHSRSRQRRK